MAPWFRRAAFACVPVFLGAAGLSACQRDLRLDAAGLSRAGWDSLYVAPEVSGGTPDSLAVLVFAGRDTVLAGGTKGAGPLLVHLPDAQLPSDGAFLVEVCAFQKAKTPACAQDVLRASPKRFRTRLEVTYPLEDGRDRDHLAYAFAWRVERLRAHRDGYEVLEGRTPGNARLRVVVDGAPDATALSVPLRYASGTVALPTQEGYDAFWMALNDRFFYGDTTLVRVDLHAGAHVLASETLVLRPRTQEERRDEMHRLAQAFSRTLARYKGGTSGEATPDRWAYNRIQQRYEITMASAWRDTSGAPQRLEGKLTVREDGSDARFDGRVPGDTSKPVLTYRFDRLVGITSPSKIRAAGRDGTN